MTFPSADAHAILADVLSAQPRMYYEGAWWRVQWRVGPLDEEGRAPIALGALRPDGSLAATTEELLPLLPETDLLTPERYRAFASAVAGAAPALCCVSPGRMPPREVLVVDLLLLTKRQTQADFYDLLIDRGARSRALAPLRAAAFSLSHGLPVLSDRLDAETVAALDDDVQYDRDTGRAIEPLLRRLMDDNRRGLRPHLFMVLAEKGRRLGELSAAGVVSGTAMQALAARLRPWLEWGATASEREQLVALEHTGLFETRARRDGRDF